MAVVADIFEAAAHEAERFIFRSAFYLINTLYSLLVINIAADSINRIGGIADYSAVTKLVNNLLDKSRLWIIRIYFEKHWFSIWSEKFAVGTDFQLLLCVAVRQYCLKSACILMHSGKGSNVK